MYRASPNDGIAGITGASSGIGRGVALELVRRGFRVAATPRRADALEALARETAGLSGKIAPYPGDVTDAAGVADLVAIIEAREQIALAFLNAGAYNADPPNAFGTGGFHRTVDLNLGGTANCLGPLLRRMAARRCGKIAINASLAGYGGMPQATAYGASKAALINMAESLRLSLGAAGVTIQVVNPGFVKASLSNLNHSPMPFIVPLDEAARRICDGFARGGFEIAFPRRLAWPMKAIRLLPYPVYSWVVGKMTGDASKNAIG